MQATLTLMGLYNYLYDEDTNTDVLFQNLSVPAGTFDLDTLKATILLRGGEFEVLYPNPDFLVPMIGIWSAKWQNTMQRWWDAFDQEYSPIENYDRYEEWSDSGSGTGSGSSSGTSSGSETSDVSAFDANTYQPKDKVTSSGSNSGNTSSSYSNSGTHTGHIHGNIGVTTNMQMIREQINLYELNLYDKLADAFLTEFIIPVS